jgi:hypothetical protein
LGSLTVVASGCAAALTDAERESVDALGRFEHVPGRAGAVVAAPHGTSDAGTLAMAKALRARTGASGVFVTGFWDGRTRQRINVNRDTEQTMGANSEVLQKTYSARAAHVNARYTALVRQAAQGPLRWFFEIHSNSMPRHDTSVEVATLGVTREEARRFKDVFLAERGRRLPPEAPQLAINVAPVDKVWFNYQASSSISDYSQKGVLIETPSRVMRDTSWRARYFEVLGEVFTAVMA